jgi:ADP-ribosylation factor GTPase-activating protein 1
VHLKLGGNQKAKDFFSSQPDYSPNMSMKDKYHSHFAELYRSKVKKKKRCHKVEKDSLYIQLSAEAEGRPWTPTLVPKKPSTPTTSSTRSLNLSNEQRSSSSISLTDTKARNEEYFAKLGNVNDSRPE